MTGPVTRNAVGLLALAGILLGGFSVACSQLSQQRAASAEDVEIDARSIGGVVVNGGKPEAGVWVVAETASLPTHFTRIVVTDDRGRFVVPDLPPGSYSVWVRGYGLRDSEPVGTAPGERVTLQAINGGQRRKRLRRSTRPTTGCRCGLRPRPKRFRFTTARAASHRAVRAPTRKTAKSPAPTRPGNTGSGTSSSIACCATSSVRKSRVSGRSPSTGTPSGSGRAW